MEGVGMAIKVIGAGFGRNGTMSLKRALEMLGFDKCYHMAEVFQKPEHVPVWHAAAHGKSVDWDGVFAGYQASVDWPSCNFWQEQMVRYPDAKVVLSERDPERWYESVMNTIYPMSIPYRHSEDPQKRSWGMMIYDLVWQGTFGGRIEDKDHAIDVYQAHNRKVKETVPADRLLVHESSAGWEPLCQFLECPVPQEDYPSSNSTEEFKARAAARAVE
jgi:hypothetical protein